MEGSNYYGKGKIMLAEKWNSNCAEFNSIEDLQKTMKVHLPNGEWVEDMNGNRLDIKIQYAR